MYVRVIKSGPRNYLRLVESYRDGKTGKVKQRTVANLFRIDGENDEKLKALRKYVGISSPGDPEIEYGDAKEFGNVFLLNGIWDQLGLEDALLDVLCAKDKNAKQWVALIRALVFHRVCDPGSKRSCGKWLKRAEVPNIPRNVSYQALLRAMDLLTSNFEEVERALAKLLCPLLDRDLTLAMYDLTTVRVFGETNLQDDLRRTGKSKETGGVARQFVLGVVQSGDGIPLMHKVHKGNVAETKTLVGMVEDVLDRYPVRRIVTVADRGLLSQKNVEQLVELATKKGRDLQFILGIPARRYRELTNKVPDFNFNEDGLREDEFMGQRLVVAYSAKIAREQSAKRLKTIKKLEKRGEELNQKLRNQDNGTAGRGRPLTLEGVVKELKAKVKSKGLSRIVKVIDTDGSFEVTVDEKARKAAENFDGKMSLLTNAWDLTLEEIVEFYRNRNDIEQGFRTVKSELRIAPVFHRLPDRIKAHAAICYLALLLNRIMRMRLRANGSLQSPADVINVLSAIKLIEVSVNGETHKATTRKTEHQLDFFDKIEVARPQ